MTNNSKIALITGATSGFGVIIASHLIARGYFLIVLGRGKQKLEELHTILKRVNKNCQVDTIPCDLSSIESVVHACEIISAKYPRIDLMILNAGVWNFRYIETEDHLEETFQVNLLMPYFIFKSLRKLLVTNNKSKVIFTASGLHQGTIHFSDLGFKRRFSGFNAYRQSKLGIILITRLLAIKPEHAGIGFYCVHPGMVKTAIGRNASWFSQLIFKWLGQSKENGAKTHLHLIDHPTSELTSGGYYARANLSKSSSASYDMNCGEKLLHVLNEYSVIQSRGVTHES